MAGSGFDLLGDSRLMFAKVQTRNQRPLSIIGEEAAGPGRVDYLMFVLEIRRPWNACGRA